MFAVEYLVDNIQDD